MKELRYSRDALAHASSKVESWVARTHGNFSAFVLGKENNFDNTDLRDQIIDDLLRRGLIEQVGRRHGFYRAVDRQDEIYDWMTADEAYYPLSLPLGIHELCKVSPGNVVLVAGQTNAGKSTFMHITNHMNLSRFGGWHQEINLFVSEGAHELKRRLLGINPDPSMWEGLKVRLRRNQYHHALKDGTLNVIDYLKVHDNFYEVAKKLERIGAAVPNGCAMVAMQMKRGEDTPRGGDFGLEECRLAVALMYDRETQIRTCRIIKCKFPADPLYNPEGMEIDFEILPNGMFQPVTKWEYVDKEKREQRRKLALFERKREFNRNRGF